jgi:hypothetical protein
MLQIGLRHGDALDPFPLCQAALDIRNLLSLLQSSGLQCLRRLVLHVFDADRGF